MRNPSQPSIAKPTAAQVQSLRRNIALFMKLLDHAGIDGDRPGGSTVQMVEELAAWWSAAHDEAQFDPKPVADAAGTVLGSYLTSVLRLKWRCVTDESGESLALWAANAGEGRRDIVVHVCDSVFNRLADGAPPESIGEYVDGVVAQLGAIARRETDPPAELIEV